MPNTIHLTVAAIVKKDDHFLMVTESDIDVMVLNQPAGHVEPGEDILEAAIRETLEETGWRILLTGFIGIYTYKSHRNGITYYRLCFIAEPIEKDDSEPLDSDIEEVHWMTAQQIRDCVTSHRSPLVLECLEDYLKGQIFPLEIFHNHL